MRTLFLNPPSFEGFDGGASSRWPSTREIESYWYPVWLCYPAGMIPDSKVVDAPPHGISIEQTVAMAILDWGGNLIESHAMEGAPMNAIDTALLKAKSALRWRRPTSETNKIVRSGENLAPTFMNDFPQNGALPIVLDNEVIGAMGVSSADGEKCAKAAIDKVFAGKATFSTR